ncbi:MAG: lipase [Actinobacteria bacterium]|nr:lipase [Actinomycetota bacterium]
MRRLLAVVVLSASAGALALPAAAAADEAGPALETPPEQLAAGLDCPDTFDDPAHQPLLLVHGTFTNAWENWSWNWQSVLTAAGWDVCAVTLPNRSLGDMQVQAEYVVAAIREMARRSGGELVDVMGHSQGALHPRWAVKWWPDVRQAVDDVVMLAGPNHGTGLASGGFPSGCFESCWQMRPGSSYLTALNADDETPGEISYTSIYTLTDELVQPQAPVSTSAIDGASNVLIQDLCPGRPVDHAFLMSDHAVHDVVIDALTNPGPASLSRIDPVKACAGVFFDGVNPLTRAAEMMQRSMQAGFPEFENATAEPALRPYASGNSGAPGSGGPGGGGGGVVVAAGSAGSNALGATEVTPATGGAPSLAAALLILPMIARRRLLGARGR